MTHGSLQKERLDVGSLGESRGTEAHFLTKIVCQSDACDVEQVGSGVSLRLRDVAWLVVFLDVRLLWCKEPKLSLLTQVPECGAGLKALGKFLFIGRQAGANQTSVGEGKAKLLHFLFGFLRRPTLSGHTVGCNHHSLAFVTHTAIDENLLAWIVSKLCKELRERFIFWKGTPPGHGHVLHSEMCHEIPLWRAAK